MDLQRYYPILCESTLFRGMPDKTLDVLLGRLRPRLQRCEKGALLLLAGYENRELGPTPASWSRPRRTKRISGCCKTC